jgi:hypothetical protein
MFILVVFVSTTAIMAETESHVTLTGIIYNYDQIIPNNGTISYENGSNYNSIGNYYQSNNLRHFVFRSYWYYSLSSIPTNATITGVYVTITNTNQNAYSLNLTSVLSQSTDAGDNWAAIGNGSTIYQGVQYNPDMFSSSPIKDLIQSDLSQRYIIIGALSQSEATDGSTSSMTMSLYISYTIPVSFTAHNDMDGYTGGYIGVGVNASPSSRTSPYSDIALVGQTANIQAYDNNNYNSNNGYYYLFNDTEAPQNKSELKKQGGGTQLNYGSSATCSYTFQQNDNNSEFVAKLKKICNATFQNTGNQITINGNYYSSSGTVQVVEQNTVTVSTVSQYSTTGMDFTFSTWTSGGSNYSSPITVSSTTTYTAKYIGTPNNVGKNQSYGSTFNVPIVIYWVDNPNVYVNQYQIYRKIGDNGTPAIIGTVGRGVQQYTDNDYIRVNDSRQTRLFYDVREYYSIDYTYSPQSWILVFGSDFYKIKENEGVMASASEIPTEYKLENYPNPFNPVTVINYQLPQDGFVILKVYDMLGKEVAAVVNEYKNAGYYIVNFDASRLTSGVYIYTINTNNFFLSKKMLLMK